MLVSVCLASYNGANFIEDQLSSILESLSFARIDDFEIIISDDGSTDLTKNIVAKFCDSRICLISGPGSGVVRNFEFLLGLSQGDIIFLSDQDDVWMVDKVATCLKYLSCYDVVVSDAKVVDVNLIELNKSYFFINSSRRGLFKNLFKNSYVGCCLCFTRKALCNSQALPFPRFIPMHDWWLGLCFERRCNVYFLQLPLVKYRRHSNNVTSLSKSFFRFNFGMLIWRAFLIYYLLKRHIY